MGLGISNLDNDAVQVLEAHRAYRIDFGQDAVVSSLDALIDLQVYVETADPRTDRVGIDPASGFTLSNGLSEGSVLSYQGTRIGKVGEGGSGVYNFHISFDVSKEDDRIGAVYGGTASKLLQALTYTYEGDTVPANFFCKVGVILSNWSDYSVTTVSLSKAPGSSGNGGNTAPEIAGDLTTKTVSDAAMTPFSGVTITDAEGDFLTVSVTVDQSGRGSFLASSLSGGSYNATTGEYTISGTPAQVQAAVQKLVFVPIPMPAVVPTHSEHLSFQIVAYDGRASTSKTVDREMWVNRNDVVTGGKGNDKLYGYSGKDKLSGNNGNDKLWGGMGNDTLTGGAGKDAFVFDTTPNKSTNKDTIRDFKPVDDAIWLDNAIFTKLGSKGSEAAPAQLKSSYFTIGSKAKDKNDYIIYDNKKGVLLYDADGSGSKIKAVEIASLSKNLPITYKDFFVI
jgi:RTX calcium-binding nonapeptide repeat (4 copies)